MQRVLYPYGLIALVVALLGFTGFLFVVQNSGRTTQLSLDLGVAAWQLSDPVSVPALIGTCFGAGFILGLLTMSGQAARLARRARRLEQQLSMASLAAPRTPSAGSQGAGDRDRYK